MEENTPVQECKEGSNGSGTSENCKLTDRLLKIHVPIPLNALARDHNPP